MSLINEKLKPKFEAVLSRYPADQRQSAVIPLLHLLQEELGGHLTHEAQFEVAAYVGIPVSKVHEVVTFYTMLSEKPRGKNHLLVCQTLPCALTGCESVTKAIQAKLGVDAGQVTADGKFSFEGVECLAQCHLGPVVQVHDQVYGNLTPESAAALIDKLGKA